MSNCLLNMYGIPQTTATLCFNERILSFQWMVANSESRLQKMPRVSDRWGLRSRQDTHAVSSKVQGALQKIRRRAATCNLLGKTQLLQSWTPSSCKCVRKGLSRVRRGCGGGQIQGVPSLSAELPTTDGCREMGESLTFSYLPTGYLTRLQCLLSTQWWHRWSWLN